MYMTKQKKIKILHVAECIGGVDKYLHSLLKYTERNKYETIVVLSHLYNASEYKTIFYKGIMPSEVGFRFSSGL